MKHLIPLLTLLTLSVPAMAQSRVTDCSATTPNNAVCITWTAPTTTTDGLPTVLPMTYRVQQQSGTGAFADVATGLSVLKFYAQNLAPGTYTFRVYANCAAPGCVESNASNTVSKAATAVPVQPNAPVLIIAVLIRADGTPVYRRVAQVTPRAGEFIIIAPQSASVLYASN